MSVEQFDITPEVTEAPDGEAKLSSFQNPSFSDMVEHDLMPKIRFTTDKEEAAEAAAADRSNPLHLPDAVFYVEPRSDFAGEKPAVSGVGSFQNDSFGIDVSTFTHDTGEAASGDYAGPSPDSINLKIESDVRHLTYAQEQLDRAIETGTGVITAMGLVESAQAVLDADMKLYNEAIAFRAPDGPVAASAEAGSGKLGSVSHAQWELEQAYESGNRIAIDNARRNLAHEKAREEAKK